MAGAASQLMHAVADHGENGCVKLVNLMIRGAAIENSEPLFFTEDNGNTNQLFCLVKCK